MRFMIIVKADAKSEAGIPPTAEAIAAMVQFNEELIKAGVLLAGEGLQSSAMGARMKRQGGKLVVTDGPFTESKELVAGFWIIDVTDKEEALAWMRKIPFEEGEEMELRKVFEASDYPPDSVSEEDLRKEREWRAENQRPITSL